MTLSRLFRVVACLIALCACVCLTGWAQGPVALPYTMTTVAGTSPIAATAGTQCPNLPTGVVSTDVYGDGCLAVNGIFGAAGRGGVQVDSFGNIFVADDVDSVIHMINASSGIMTKIAGQGTACSGKVDTSGDGCLAATQTTASSQRGMGIDPWGNIFLPGYGDHLVHVICRTASPLCTPAQVGYMELVAGCVTTSLSGTTGVGSDNVQAAQTGIASCGVANGEIDTPRGVTADLYGNVYFAETASFRFRVVLGPQTSSYFSGTNPLWAALGVHYAPLTQGYAYTVVNIGGDAAATTKGNACSETTNSVTYSGTALDTYGDGCPLDFSSVSTGSSSYVQGVATDAAGNLVFTDPGHDELRVFFVSGAGKAGAAMAAAITANNSSVTAPQPGFVYTLAGGGSTTISSTATLGTSTGGIDSSIFKVAVSPQGNIFIGDSTKVLFFDINTGYIRTLITGSSNVTAGSYCNGSSGQTSLSAYSDGCPASKSLFTNSNGLGLSVDGQGNLYLYDASSNTAGMLVRKVLAQGLAEQTVGTALSQTFEVHLPESASGTVSGATATLSATADMTAGTPACSQNADHSVDCTVTVNATPSAAGTRSAALTLGLPAGTWENSTANLALNGVVTGSVLAFDNASSTVSGTATAIAPTTNAVFSGIAPVGVALDGAGNVYTMDTKGGQFVESVQGVTSALTGTLPVNPSQIAVDHLGDVFAVGNGTPSITELAVSGAPASVGAPSTYASASIPYTPVSGTTAPQAIAVDVAGNLFVADQQSSSANTAVYRLSLSAGAVAQQTLVASGFANPVSLAVDGSGNVYVADKGAGAVYKLAPGLVSGVPGYVQTTALSSVSPVAVAVDAAGDLYVQDAISLSVIEVPASGPNTTVFTGLTTPSGLAVDGKGNVYSADLSQASITQVVRDAVTYNFGSSITTTLGGTLSNVGNQSVTGSNTATDTVDFAVVGGTSNACPFTTSVLGALTAGQACTLSATFTPQAGTGTVSDVLSYLPAASTVGNLTLMALKTGAAITTTTTISGESPTSPVYVASGTTVSFNVSVAASSGTASGTVMVTVDSGTATGYTLNSSGVVTVPLSGITAGSHTIAASYATQNGYTGSNSATVTFSVAQASTAVSWAPGATSVPVSQAIGTSVLNAAVTPSVAGNFTYTATPSGGSAVTIDASSYLAIGTYTLTATFTPVDAVDYVGSTTTVSSFTVAKANTTAGVGASTNVVAADGSGNYTTLTAALLALPVTGGTIYLKPGTYTGQNAISYPNVALRGLGGDPTKVILSGEDGAFSSPFVYPGSGAGNASASGDQGSSTLDVSKSAYIANQATAGSVTYTPVNFFAEYLTIQNTYNTDTTTTSTYSTASGSCANTGSAQSLQALYNAGTQCNSQALALWITADQAVLNHVNLTSQQDTLYAGSQGCGSSCTPARQYMWQGTITGDVDYVFGDAAMVYDHTTFFTTWHGGTATGTETIEAQNKKYETGSSNDYLSGYICNSCTLLSQSTGMTNLYYGRPYGAYSTWIMLNSNVDQVNPVGWIEFSGDTNLPTSTYAEFNSIPYTDPTVGTNGYPAALPGSVTPTGGNTGTGVTGTRETESQDPGTIETANTIKTTLTAAEAAQYAPVTFLSTTVPTQSYAGFQANWNPVTSLASSVNSFAPAGNVTVAVGTSLTILGRPVTPGPGIIPTGTYQFLDGSTVLTSGSLDASGEAYLSTTTLSVGTHTITMTYGGDANFNASSSSSTFTVQVSGAPLTSTTTLLTVTNSSIAYGGTISGSVSVTPSSGSVTPTGTVNLLVDGTTAGSCTLSSGACSYTLSGVAAGNHLLTANYGGDSNNATSTSSGITVSVARGILQVAANNITVVAGQALPAYTATITGFVNGDTQAIAVTGTPSLTTTPTAPSAVGEYQIVASTGTLAANNYTFTFTNGVLAIQSTSAAAAVATGDTRNVTEPTFPAVCAVLNAALTSVNDDIPTSVDATVTNPDGARIQAALNNCSGTNQAVELSVDGAGHNAFLTGPLNMPSGVTLLVDPAVTVYFSRNVQDYDLVQGTHTCGTVNGNTATNSCLPLINVTGVSNVGIMGFGKLDGRGGDTLINAFPSSYAGQSWWGLSAIANSGGNQQNPRFVQLGNSSNITLYKITLRNSPLFHVSTTGSGVNAVTLWDVKIVTPTSSRNTDGIDPDQAQNITITRSWISDGDDNVAVGASGSSSSASVNISVTNNHLFAGHGESIGSFTSAGVSNILFDGNMLSGNSSVDSNSTGIRIKSGNDRGGVVQNIQYSNSCFQNHATEIQLTPLYDTTPGTLTPNFKNILMQNLSFLTAGTVGLTGASNNGVVNPLMVTMDNVSFASLPSSDVTPAPTNTQITLGPGQVSSDFVTNFQAYVGSNGNTLTDNRTATSLAPPVCNFTAIAPELTGPSGLPQTITSGATATAVVILTPAVGGSAYPTGTVTLTDGESSTTTVMLPGTGDTIEIPLTGLSVGTHTFTATYSGDTNYVPTVSGSPYTTTEPYVITVNAGSLGSTSTSLSGVPTTTSYGTSFTATAIVAGSNPTGTVAFVVNGVVYATSALSSSGTAQATLNLALGSYTISAIYSGDVANAGSTSSLSALSVTPGITTTTLTSSTSTTTLGVPVTFTTTVASVAGTPSGTVALSYTTANNSTPTTLVSVTLMNGTATAAVDLPIGVDNVIATYTANGSFAGSVSTGASITVNPPVLVSLPSGPMALPYTISTIAGGSTTTNADTACAGSTDSFGDGCQATAMVFNGSVDLRSVVADPFGNLYLTDANASMVRKISPNGVISNFAGYVSGTACVPSATAGCTPTLVKLNKPRGVSSDPQGNIYIAGYSDNKVYKYSMSTGLLYLVAGNGTKPSAPTAANGDGGAATSAMLNGPRGVWADSVGNIYIADTTDNKIRVVSSTGVIQTFVGTGTATSTGDNGLAVDATIDNPQGVLVDANDNVYIADTKSVRVVCVTCEPGSALYQLLGKVGFASPQNGYIYTVAGGGSSAYTGPVLATSISMSPQKLAVDNGGNLYISDGSGAIWFVDSRTAFIRAIAGNSTTACSTATNSIGDGCPATQAIIGDGGNGIGVGTDTLGNIYISDTLNARIRKVSTNLVSPATATGSTATQPVLVHYIAGDGPAATNALAFTSSEWKLGSPACTTNADTTTDCLINASFTPAVPGARSTPLTLNSSAGNTAFVGLSGVGLGAGATLDPASQISFGANLQAAGLATDNAGNVYVADANSKSLLRFAPASITQGTSATAATLATLTSPSAVAVDARGYVYVADSSTGQITQVSPAGVATTLAFQFTKPDGLAVDALDNLYVSDASAQAVYQLSPITGAQVTLPVGSLSAPAGLAIDPSGNLLITDPGAGAIYRFSLQSGTRTAVSSSAVKPSAIQTDAAGNLLIADTASILAVPASSNSAGFTVASLAPSALAIDSAGNLYTGSNGGVTKLTRTQGSVSFATATAAPQTVSMLESGNQALQLSSVSQTDTTDYSLTAGASTDCTVSGGLPSGLAVGGACTLTATFTPTTFANPTDTATFNGNLANANLSTPSAVQMVLTGPTTPPTAAITLGAFSPSSPVYGQTVTVSATVSGPAVTPTGTVVFTVDGSAISTNLASGVATATLTGLSAGTHTISAAYTSTDGFSSAATSPVTLTVAQASTSVALVASPNPATQGQPDLLTATVSGPGTLGGSVVFTAGGKTLCTSSINGSGVATCSFTPSVPGSLAITAQYQGDQNHTGSQTSLTLTVYDIAIQLQLASTQLTYPGATNVTVCVSPATSATATGTVQIYDGTTLLTTLTLGGNGCGYWYISPGLSAGTHHLTAVYSGDKNNPAGSSVPVTVTVSPVTTNMSASCWNSSFAYGANYQCTVSLSSSGGSATGSITYTLDGGAAVSVPISNGSASFTITEPAAGSHNVVISYAQQGNFSAAGPQTESFTVTPAPVNVALTPSTWYSTVGTSVTFSVSVTSWSAGAPNANGAVSFYDGTTLLAMVPVNSNGQASYTTSSLPVGSQTITATYAGGTNYATGSTSVTITLVK
jgi:sugar lactone lactonase YvrE